MILTDDDLRRVIELAKAADAVQKKDVEINENDPSDYWYCPSALYAELDHLEDAHFVSECSPDRIIELCEEVLRFRKQFEFVEDSMRKLGLLP